IVQYVVVDAFKQGVDDVQHEKHQEGAVEPLSAGLKIPPKPVVFGNVVGKQQGGQHGEDAGIDDKEKVSSKRPGLDVEQRKLEPPEVHDEKQHKRDPGHVQPV